MKPAALLALTLLLIGCSKVDNSSLVYAKPGLTLSDTEIAEHTSITVPPPQFSSGSKTEGADLLFIQVNERRETRDGEDTPMQNKNSVSTFYRFNPSLPEDGLVKIFQGSGAGEECQVVTPLFNGWGIAGTSFNAKHLAKKAQLFWYNLLSGERGETIDAKINSGRLIDEYYIYFTDKLCRYNLKTGELLKTNIEIDNAYFIDRNTIITKTVLESETYIISLNIRTLAISRIARIPEHLQDAARVALAGKEGVYLINNMSLWYSPKNEPWRPVIENATIYKIFGGNPPYLPVAYVGKGRFAVAQSIKGSINRETPNHPKARCNTLLLDGKTGEVIDQSDECSYHSSPYLSISDGWKQMTEKSKDQSAIQYAEKLFKSIRKSEKAEQAVEIKGWKKIVIAKNDRSILSKSGRFLTLYRKFSSHWGKDENYLKFTIFDAQNHTLHDEILEAHIKNMEKMYIMRISWLQLANDPLEKNLAKHYKPDRFDRLYDLPNFSFSYKQIPFFTTWYK